MRVLMSLALLTMAMPAMADGGADIQVPRATTQPLDELFSSPAVSPSLPAAAVDDTPDGTKKGDPGTLSAPVEVPTIQQPGTVTEHVPERGQGPAPVADLSDTPELPEEPQPLAAHIRVAFAHGVVLERNDDELVLIGDTGFVHQWKLPQKAHLISLANGGYMERSEVGQGDFVARIGVEEGTNLPIVAFLNLGEQPGANYSEFAESVEACYQHAVAAMETR